MRVFIYLIFISLIFSSCTSDEVFKSEKTDFFNIYKNIVYKTPKTPVQVNSLSKEIKNTKWLSKFNQPIILISTEDKKVQATLVALGNNSEKLTWVSADGISLTFDNGILIATRGYKQDLFASKHSNLETRFDNIKNYKKIHRYLNSENDYDDIEFICSISKKTNFKLSILEFNLLTDHFTESCKSSNYSHTNEYYLLPNTKIVLQSKQWIGPTQKAFLSYNLYAFQKL